MRSVISLLAVVALPSAMGMQFINPPTAKSSAADHAKNTVYVQGSSVNVAWTAGTEGKLTSIMLWQLNTSSGDTIGDSEYISYRTSGVTSFSWIVATTKAISISNVFFLSLFEEGKTSPDANSVFFNITQSANSQSIPTTSSPESDVATSTTTSITTPSQTSAESSSTSTVAPDSPANGLSAGAKAGISVGVVGALALGLSLGWFLFRRRKESPSQAPDTSPTLYSYLSPDPSHSQNGWGMQGPAPGMVMGPYDPETAYKGAGGDIPGGQVGHGSGFSPVSGQREVHELS